MRNKINIKKFPRGGYNVVVLRKEDVVQAIDDNIIDKDVALDIVRQCEIDAANFVREGRTASIPYIGTIYHNEPRRAIINGLVAMHEEKLNMSKKEYLLFKRKLATDRIKKLNYDKSYMNLFRIARRANKELYLRTAASYGESYAKFYMYLTRKLSYIEP